MYKNELCRHTSAETVRPVSKNGDCKCQCYDRLFCGQARRVYFINYECYDRGQFCVKKRKKEKKKNSVRTNAMAMGSVANRVDGVVQVKITRGLHSERWRKKKERKKKRKKERKKKKKKKRKRKKGKKEKKKKKREKKG